MKLALCQLNYTIGAFEQNTSKILKVIHDLESKQVDIVVFSELALCGYPPLDLLESNQFVLQSQKYIQLIADACQDITVIIGAPSPNELLFGKKLHNSAYVLSHGKIIGIHHKT
ncbi:MAG: NAD+ synthase, partial [Bacteroidetes bacterium HGW-Bacteroidetes-21]